MTPAPTGETRAAPTGRRRTAPIGGRRTAPIGGTRAAFTFIELLVVITLLGLMSAIVVANLDGITSRASLNASARELGNLVLSLRDQAAMQQHELIVEIDLAKQRWRVVDVPSPADVTDAKDREDQTYYGPYYEPKDGVRLDSVAFSKDDVEQRGVIKISFDADGQLVPAGFVAYFRHEDMNEDDGVSVEVTGLTGLVDYQVGRKRSEEIRSPDEF